MKVKLSTQCGEKQELEKVFQIDESRGGITLSMKNGARLRITGEYELHVKADERPADFIRDKN